MAARFFVWLAVITTSSVAAGPPGPRCLIQEHPLVTAEHVSEERGEAFGCLKLELQANDMSRREGFSGRLVIENSCEVAVALLLSPVEIRVREAGGRALLNEHMIHAAYARLYFISAESNFDEAFSEIDGGLSVYGAPSYLTVPKGSVSEVPIHGGAPTTAGIPTGRYLVTLETLAALTTNAGDTGSQHAIDLDESVATHNARLGGEPRLFLRSGAQWIGSAGPVISVRE